MRLLVSALLATSLVVASIPARAHGGLPISENIFWRGETMYVPSMYWGVFFGTDGGPWRWICEEAINQDQARLWALQGDGTFHVTDFAGVTTSRDGGCTWVSSTGDIAARQTSAVVADPADPKRAWATTNQYTTSAAGAPIPWNALFVTVDDGVTWTTSFTAAEYLYGAAISADGQRVYVVGVLWAGPAQLVLHVSRDGGQTWNAVPFTYLFAGAVPSRVVAVAVDPNDVETLYARVETSATSVLLRVSSDGKTVTELLSADGTLTQQGIGGVAFDSLTNTVYAGAKTGLYRSVGGAAMQKMSNLDQAQCISNHDGKLYACSWDYPPDDAAVARSNDGGQTFTKVFQYADTVAPIASCPSSSTVSTICPLVWEQYCTQLGIASCNDVPVPDGGVAMSTPLVGCAISAASRAGTTKWIGVGAALALLGSLLARRQRREKALPPA